MRFIRKASNFINKARNKGVSAGENVANTIKNIVATKLKFSFLAPIFIPLISIVLIFLIISSMFGEKLNLLQMVDPGGNTENSSKNCSTTSDWGQALVDKAREKIGTPYCSVVHGPPSDGSQGFGCAMFVAWVYNQVFFNGEDKFSGDTQAFWNNVTKQNYNTNESFVEVSAEEAQPGDVVVYTECEGSYSCAAHVALYTGNGRIIGSWGISGGNTQCCDCYPGVEEGSVESQQYNTTAHYLHYTNASSNGVTTCGGNGIYTEADFEKYLSVSNTLGVYAGNPNVESVLANSSFGSVDNFNKHIKDSVKNAGYGTRQGVVAAAVSLAGDYVLSAGQSIHYSQDLRQYYHGGDNTGIINKNNMYLDCSAFAWWSLYNGGFKMPCWGQTGSIYDWAAGYGNTIKSDVTQGQPGDFLDIGDYHIMVIVGKYDGGYYAAEALYEGVIITKHSFGSVSAYSLLDMTKYYSDVANIDESRRP